MRDLAAPGRTRRHPGRSAVPRAAAPWSRCPVTYDGPDLDDVARLTGLTPARGRRRPHRRRPWRVAFGGFAPGFAYLVGGDPRLRVPRRDHPRPSVPGRGRRAGRRVLRGLPAALPRRLAAPRHDDARALGRRPRPAGAPHARHHRALRRRPAGRRDARRSRCSPPAPSSSSQDEGRPGLAAVGVGRSGAADRTSHRLGARLVGHPTDRAALEVLLGGLSVRAHGRMTVALTGAPAPATVDGRPVAHAALVDLPDGAVLTLGMPSAGLRTYLTVRGGIDVPPVLGSRSTDTLSRGRAATGGGRRRAAGRRPGRRLPPRRPRRQPAPRSRTQGPAVLEVLPGPRSDWVGGWADGGDLGGLLSGAWQVVRATATGSGCGSPDPVSSGSTRGRTPSCPARASSGAPCRCRREASPSSSSPTTR